MSVQGIVQGLKSSKSLQFGVHIVFIMTDSSDIGKILFFRSVCMNIIIGYVYETICNVL